MSVLRSLIKRLGYFLVIGGLAVGAAFIAKEWRDRDTADRDGSGAIVEDGRVDAFSIQPGDCFLEPPSGDIASVEAIPCSAPHDLEAYHLFELDGDLYPGDSPIDSKAEDECVSQAPVDLAAGTHTISWIKPSVQTWTQVKDRAVVCTIENSDGSQMVGSLTP